MSRLTIPERRMVAIEMQILKTSSKTLHKKYGRFAADRWKNVDCCALDQAFSDAPRAGRPPILNENEQKAVMKRLERDLPNPIEDCVEHFGISESTVWRIGHSLGDLVSRDYSVHISEKHCTLRVEYSESQLGSDHSKKAWFDHTVLQIPPEPTRQKVWRAKNSTKPVPRALRRKNKTRFLMGLTGAGDGTLSDPFFCVNAVRRKRNTKHGKKGGLRYEVYTVDQDMMEIDLENEIFPFMVEHGCDELILDNASCQDGLRDFIESKGFKTPGFASARRQDKNGFPPNSPDLMLLDACVFGRFKVLFAHENPKTIPEAMRVAKKIVKSMRGVSKKWIDGLDALYREIITMEGEGSHLISG